MVETRGQELERANYLMLKSQQQILLAAVDAQRYEKHQDTANSPQQIIDTIDKALEVLKESIAIVNSASTATADIREANTSSLSDMTAKAEEIRNKLAAIIKKETEDKDR